VLNMRKYCICSYILESKERKKEFFKFWRLFINLDALSGLTLATTEEGEQIQNYLKNIYTAYRNYLQEKSLEYLLVQNGVKEKSIEFPLTPAPSSAETVKPASATAPETVKPASATPSAAAPEAAKPPSGNVQAAASAALEAVKPPSGNIQAAVPAPSGNLSAPPKGGSRKFSKTRKQIKSRPDAMHPDHKSRKVRLTQIN
jgi:hypothetical protein